MIRRGDVYYINKNGYETGSEQWSGRPAIIVSNDQNNAHSSTYEIVYMTSQPKTDLPTHATIRRGLPKPSTVLCEQITTVHESRLGNFMCHLPDDAMEIVDTCLAISLGLDLYDQEDATEGYDDAEDFDEPVDEPVYEPIDEPVDGEIGKKTNVETSTELMIARREADFYRQLCYELMQKK